jgi:hypothetical protein
MKIIVRISQFIVGLLFIISGLVKANDPLGLSYKMQEFFELWNSSLSKNGKFGFLVNSFEFLHAHSLALSIIMITLEVVAGLALLTAWQKKLTTWLLFILILFFAWLTGYAYLSGKFTNCGCFGDCLPITPLTSFLKDVILLALIVLLLSGIKYIQPFFSYSRKASGTTLLIGLIATVLLQWYVLNYLPIADCLPFKKGNNISQQMKPPPNSLPDSFSIRFIYEKNGKQYEFSPEQLPADFATYKFIDRKQVLIRKGNADPPIKGFSLTGVSGEDSTEAILHLPKAYLFFIQYFEHASSWVPSFKAFLQKAESNHIPAFVITSDRNGIYSGLSKAGIALPVFICDFTVIRTASRTTPELYYIKDGTVYNKFGYHELNKAIGD